ncbi:MAG: polyprenyl synthetase family protein [Candidatus Pacebacteria bacterium]|nr:polyprenyl synthetase family protein [Candidatus Paceibacterota bacterium]
MEIGDHLDKLKKQVNSELRIFFKSEIKRVKIDNNSEELLEIIKSLEKFILNSGKRIRPILFYFGYIIGGGKKRNEALKTSIAVELIHSYFLIHDDIIDRDDFRHGDFSMHYSYEKKAKDKFKNTDSKHFGISMAIIVGDLALTLGYKILNNSDFKNDLKVKALNNLDEIVYHTIFGQALDLTINKTENFNIEKIFEMQKYKTAKYTIEGPLSIGAILAGSDEKFLSSLSRFAIPAGIAFQIQDDIIGIFGNEKKTGKHVGSDIKEGKKTLLIANAMEKADGVQRQILNNALGNENINSNNINNVRDVIIKTGSLEFSKNKAKELIKDAKESLNDLKISEVNKKFLNDLADFIIQRKY